METVGGMVDVDTVDEVGVGAVEEVLVIVDVEEDMVVGTCNKSLVVTMAMVDQGHLLLKPAVSKCTLNIIVHPSGIVYFSFGKIEAKLIKKNK